MKSEAERSGVTVDQKLIQKNEQHLGKKGPTIMGSNKGENIVTVD